MVDENSRFCLYLFLTIARTLITKAKQKRISFFRERTIKMCFNSLKKNERELKVRVGSSDRHYI